MSSILMFSAKPYDRESFERINSEGSVGIKYLDTRLTAETVGLADGHEAVCAFVNDELDAEVLTALKSGGTSVIAMRCAGFNNVDVDTARELGLTVVRVPAYSPNSVAEHTLALILALNRKIPRAYNRVRDGNFALDGLVGFDMSTRTAAVVGTGTIGAIVARLLWHFRCDVVAVDPNQNEHLLNLGVKYVPLDEALATADIVSLNCPLMPSTHHLINENSIRTMKPGAMLVNTSRGQLVDTTAVVDALKSGQIGSYAADVYEEESDLFFEDRSGEIIDDDRFARLLTFPNVLITAHQAFLTTEALDAIASITLENVETVLSGGTSPNALTP